MTTLDKLPIAEKVPITWHEIAWNPRLIVQPRRSRFSGSRLLGALKLWRIGLIPHRNRPICRDSAFTLRSSGPHCPGRRRPSRRRASSGFTLVELLVVIAIIGILAALILPVLKTVKNRTMTTAAKKQIALIVNGLTEYESDYGFLPTSTAAKNASLPRGDDFTYGEAFRTPNGIERVESPLLGSPGPYQANNAELMSILLDIESWPIAPAVPTINQGHVKNTRGKKFLPAQFVSDTNSPGVGSDGVYRDPWGSPYVITIDLNNDGKARDAFYRTLTVSEDPSDTTNPKRGLNGLIRARDAQNNEVFEASAPVTVWSAGADRMIDPGEKANKGVNKDNVLSWK